MSFEYWLLKARRYSMRFFEKIWDALFWIVEMILVRDLFLFIFTLFAIYAVGYYCYTVWNVLMV